MHSRPSRFPPLTGLPPPRAPGAGTQLLDDLSDRDRLTQLDELRGAAVGGADLRHRVDVALDDVGERGVVRVRGRWVAAPAHSRDPLYFAGLAGVLTIVAFLT